MLALDAHAFPGGADLSGDRLVLGRKRVDDLRLVDQVVETLRSKQDLQRARLALFVEVDEPVAEPVDERAVLAAVEVVAARLQPEELVQARELLLVQLQVALERLELGGDDADLRGESADLAVDRRDLRRERALALLRPGDLRLHPLQPCVDRGLPASDIATRRGRHDREEQRGERHESAKTHLDESFGGRADVPAPARLFRRRRRARVGSRLGNVRGARRLRGLRDGLRHRDGLGRRARLRRRLGRRRGRLDLGRLHLEVCALESLHRSGCCLLHLLLLRPDRRVQLGHPGARRRGPFVVTSVHGFAQNAGTFRPFCRQGVQLAAQFEEPFAGGRVDGDGLEGVPVVSRTACQPALRARAGRKTPKKRGRAVSYSTGTWPVSSGGTSCTAVSPGSASTRVPHSGQKRPSPGARCRSSRS